MDALALTLKYKAQYRAPINSCVLRLFSGHNDSSKKSQGVSDNDISSSSWGGKAPCFCKAKSIVLQVELTYDTYIAHMREN